MFGSLPQSTDMSTLSSGLDSVGEMKERKSRNDNHFAMIEEIHQAISDRRINDLHRVETLILRAGSSSLDSENFQTLLEMLKDSSRENPARLNVTDKLRLLTIYLLSMYSPDPDDPDVEQAKQVVKAFQEKETSLQPKFAAYVTKLLKTREEAVAKAGTGSKGSNLLGKVATKGFDMVSRAIKRDRSTKVEELLAQVCRQNYKIDKFEVSTPMYNSLVEDDLEAHLDCKSIIVYSIDGGNWNEYEAVERMAASPQAKGLPVS